MEKNRISNIDFLRAVAALAVCLFHFNRSSFTCLDWLAYGKYGVEVFFVISGFIISYSLDKWQYSFLNYKAFLISRFIRLYPPFFLACIASITISYVCAIVPGYKGEMPDYSWDMILSNLLLISDFNERGWLIPVFWTLAMEAQFYVLMAVCFIGFKSQRCLIRHGMLILWVVLPLCVGTGPTIFTYLGLFTFGVIGYMWRVKYINAFAAVLYASGVFFCHGFISQTLTNGWLSSSVGLISIFCILFTPQIKCRLMSGLGYISYSLYLFHEPVGERIINLAERLPDHPLIRIAAVIFTVFICICIAGAIFYVVEKPAHILAKKIRVTLWK